MMQKGHYIIGPFQAPLVEDEWENILPKDVFKVMVQFKSRLTTFFREFFDADQNSVADSRRQMQLIHVISERTSRYATQMTRFLQYIEPKSEGIPILERHIMATNRFLTNMVHTFIDIAMRIDKLNNDESVEPELVFNEDDDKENGHFHLPM